MFDPTDRGQFLNFAGIMEGGLVAVAFFLGWIAEISPVATLRFEWQAVAWGVAATIPIFVLFLASHHFPIGPLLPIKRFLIDMLGPSLAVCRWYDLILLALLAGFGEELVFRGVLQPWIGGNDFFWIGLIASNVIFGLLHLITPLYAVLAMVIGIYLGLIGRLSSEENVLIPIITHALYDYLAFLIVVRQFRKEQRESESVSSDAVPRTFE